MKLLSSVDLLTRRRDAGSCGCRGARERGRAAGVGVALELVALVVGHARILGRLLVTEADVVVDELAPDPAPLRDVVLREEVLTDVVDDAVAHIPWRRSVHEAAHP